MRIIDWSADVCPSDLCGRLRSVTASTSAGEAGLRIHAPGFSAATSEKRDQISALSACASARLWSHAARSEEHTSELQSLMRISYAVFCLKNNNRTIIYAHITTQHKKSTQST